MSNAVTEGVEAEIASVVQRVNEWDDRTSPDDYPDHLLITSEELADILRNFAAALSSLKVEGPSVKVKPLEWRHDGNSYFSYCGVTDVRWTARNPAERAYAEAERETRIRSALESSAPVKGEETQEYTLRAMAQNYAGGHSWDHLDGEACTKAADEIKELRAEVSRIRSALAPVSEGSTDE